MNILSLRLNIFNGTTELAPVYEVHSWSKAEEIIMATKALLADKPNATFSFEVFGNSTATIS
jgi:hypothetical protein